MIEKATIRLLRCGSLGRGMALIALFAISMSATAQDFRHHDDDRHFWPGNLVVSRSVYDNNASNVVVGTCEEISQNV